MVYFSLAAMWGFLAGSGAVLVGLSTMGQRVSLGRAGVLFLATAALLAVIGGIVVSAGYRAASRRYR